jgi:hypothetical protein
MSRRSFRAISCSHAAEGDEEGQGDLQGPARRGGEGQLRWRLTCHGRVYERGLARARHRRAAIRLRHLARLPRRRYVLRIAGRRHVTVIVLR